MEERLAETFGRQESRRRWRIGLFLLSIFLVLAVPGFGRWLSDLELGSAVSLVLMFVGAAAAAWGVSAVLIDRELRRRALVVCRRRPEQTYLAVSGAVLIVLSVLLIGRRLGRSGPFSPATVLADLMYLMAGPTFLLLGLVRDRIVREGVLLPGTLLSWKRIRAFEWDDRQPGRMLFMVSRWLGRSRVLTIRVPPEERERVSGLFEGNLERAS